jgi:hypothetical protein
MLYSEEVNYWMTSRSSADDWIDKTIKLLESFGGLGVDWVYGKQGAQSAYLIQFELLETKYKIIWPVLESKTGNIRAARVQAATLIYHDVKAKCLTARVLGIRAAFFNYLMLPNGKPAYILQAEEVYEMLPKILVSRIE